MNQERPFGNIGLPTERQKVLLALFQGYLSEERRGEDLLSDIRNDIKPLAFVKSNDNHAELYKRVKAFLVARSIEVPERDPNGSRRVPRRVIHSI